MWSAVIRETFSESSKAEYESFMRITPCKTCKGQRLKPSALAVTVAGKNIYEITSMSVGHLQEFLAGMKLTQQQELIGRSDPEGDQSQDRVPG